MQLSSLPFLISVALVAASAACAIRWRTRRPIAEACCAKCRYPVRGLPGTICPECGSDLSSPGAILQPGTRTAPGKLTIALFVATVIFWLAIATTPLLASLLPRMQSIGRRYQFSPNSGKFADVVIFHEGVGVAPPPVGTIKMLIGPPSGTTATIEFNPATGTCKLPNAQWQTTTDEFNAATLLRAMAISGIDTANGAVQSEADSLLQAVNQIARREEPSSSGNNYYLSKTASWGTTWLLRRWFVLGYSIWACLGIVAYFQITRSNGEKPARG